MYSVYYAIQRLPEVSRVRLQAKWAVHRAVSADTPIRRTAESTTFVSKVSPGNTVARSVQFSRSVTQRVAALARIPKMFPDGEYCFLLPLIARIFWTKWICGNDVWWQSSDRHFFFKYNDNKKSNYFLCIFLETFFLPYSELIIIYLFLLHDYCMFSHHYLHSISPNLQTFDSNLIHAKQHDRKYET